MSSIRILGNPAAGRGRGAKVIGELRRAFAPFGVTDLRATRCAGDEERLVHDALDDGIQTIVVAGGDGTWSKCAVALARAGAGADARMAFVAAGTGNDFARNLSAPAGDPIAMARLLCTGSGAHERRVDMGRVDDRWFLNVAGFGFDVAVLRAARRSRWLRGPAVYVAAAVRELFTYAGVDAAVQVGDAGADTRDGFTRTAAEWSRRLLMVFSNGACFGGSFRIAPGARVDDGALDAIVIADGPRWTRAPLLVKALRGRHLNDTRVRHARDGRFALQFHEPTWFEADGELYRTTSDSCELATLPAVLRVVDSTGND
ncbi:MAG TPA: diacylglycerol kinase family protein [Gemmatimonadaceae bacterium]|nr:diacylglycerol kinase family protein [Gemmatimonadaceae bacterium]